jgi:MoaA/NifB/PqqE/SkfB family radical SAM enzyme
MTLSIINFINSEKVKTIMYFYYKEKIMWDKKHIEINIWKACNNRCRFCMSSQYAIKQVWETFWFVKFEEIIKEIISYSKKWYDSIGFIWWEVSVHPNFFDIITESKNAWFKNINIVTNAMIFSDYKKAESLINLWTTRINISIHSHIEEIEDYLTQTKWWFKSKLKAIDNFNKLYDSGLLKSKLSINIVLNGLNYKDIVETCLYFYKIKKIDDIRINFIWNRFFASNQDKTDLELRYSDILLVLKQLIYISLKFDIRITFDSIPPCIFYKIDKINYKDIIKRFLWESFDYIDKISNINKNEVFNWKEQKKNDLKIKPKNCKDCIYNKQCEGVWKEYIEQYWDNEFIYISWNK